jgi:Dynein light intermediate chain (DLIC).
MRKKSSLALLILGFPLPGWDNMKKIGILYENMQSIKPDDYYTDVITKPIVRKPISREQDTLVEDEQSFLARQLALLQQNPAANPTTRQDNSLPQIRTPVSQTSWVEKLSL